MSMRQYIAEGLAILGPPLLALLGVVALRLATRVSPLLARWLGAKASAQALELAGAVVRTLVANAEQTLVRDLKDPNTPGTWSSVAAAAVKASVLRDVHAGHAYVVAALRNAGVDGTAINEVLGQLAERAVLELKQHRPEAIAVANVLETRDTPTPAQTPAAIGAALGAATKASDR
jgi:xanthosine utilization system XapX-like protein